MNSKKNSCRGNYMRKYGMINLAFLAFLGGLRNWQPDDDPWTEHARWFTKCGYVRLIKGDEFIAKCVDEIPTEIPPKDKDNTSAR